MLQGYGKLLQKFASSRLYDRGVCRRNLVWLGGLAALVAALQPVAPAAAASSLAVSIAPAQVQVGGRATVRVSGATDVRSELVVWQRPDRSACGSDLPSPPTILLSQGAAGLAGPLVGPGPVDYRFAAWTREAGTYRVCAALWLPSPTGPATLAAAADTLLTVQTPWSVAAQDSRGAGGSTVPLTFVVSGARRVSAQLRVLDHAKVVYSRRVGMRTAPDGARRVILWKTAPALLGSFSLCVTARDESGHVERSDHCSTVVVDDSQAPVVRALPSSGLAGTPVELRYLVADNSGQTMESIRIFQNGKVIDEVKTSLSASRKGQRYTAQWPSFPSAAGELRFCVVSRDAAGNTSRTSCAGVSVTASR
jgi:hypothetical protein